MPDHLVERLLGDVEIGVGFAGTGTPSGQAAGQEPCPSPWPALRGGLTLTDKTGEEPLSETNQVFRPARSTRMISL
jgi:hypothetical protein